MRKNCFAGDCCAVWGTVEGNIHIVVLLIIDAFLDGWARLVLPTLPYNCVV